MVKHQTTLTKTRCGGQKEATFLSLRCFSKSALPSSMILARPRWPVLGARVGPPLLGQQQGKGWADTALTRCVSDAGVSYPGAGAW